MYLVVLKAFKIYSYTMPFFQMNEKLRKLQAVEQQINEYNVILAKAKGIQVYEASKTSAA